MSKDTIPALSLIYVIAYAVRISIIGLHDLSVRIDESDYELVAAIVFVAAIWAVVDFLSKEGDAWYM